MATATVIVKFSKPGGPAARQRRLHDLLAHRLKAVRRLFPDEADEQLSSIYVVDLDGSASVADVCTSLARDEWIEYAHAPKGRTPAGPDRVDPSAAAR